MLTLPPPQLTEEQWKALDESQKDAEAVTIGSFPVPSLLPLAPKPVHPIPVTGVRRCWGCNCLYAAAAAAPTPWLCPACKSTDTQQVESASPPKQTTLFTIPPVPAPNAWRVEWRWTKKPRKGNGWQRPDPDWKPEPPNDWRVHSRYNITCLKSARNTRRRMAHLYPCKDFRVVPASWTASPLLP